jgi:hypothetical protein
MIDYSIDTTKDVDSGRLVRMISEKMSIFDQYKSRIKYWETPLQPYSLLRMIGDILNQHGIELVFEDIYDYKKNKKIYNTNLSNTMRGKDLLYCLSLRMQKKDYGEDFDSDFVETIRHLSTTAKRFRNLGPNDVLFYDYEDKEGFYFLKVCITPIRCDQDYSAFIEEFKDGIEEKYGTIIFTLKKYRPIMYLEHSMFDDPDISYIEKKKEKLVKLNDSKWAYYLPADWIRYPIKPEYTTIEARENWLTVYHPLGGFDFNSYGNIKVCDDLGPNQFNIELANFPMDQGIFVSPRLNYLIGLNQNKVFHSTPSRVKTEEDYEYYYTIAFECYVNPERLRVPSVFKRKLIIT